jgi:hypothetical protein
MNTGLIDVGQSLEQPKVMYIITNKVDGTKRVVNTKNIKGLLQSLTVDEDNLTVTKTTN